MNNWIDYAGLSAHVTTYIRGKSPWKWPERPLQRSLASPSMLCVRMNFRAMVLLSREGQLVIVGLLRRPYIPQMRLP